METLTKGKYRIYYKFRVNILVEEIASILNSLKDLIGYVHNVIESKRIKIDNIYSKKIYNDYYLIVEFELLENPVPVAVVGTAILGLFGLTAVLLIFDKIEKISESPLGTGIGVSLSVGSVILLTVGGYLLFKQLK